MTRLGSLGVTVVLLSMLSATTQAQQRLMSPTDHLLRLFERAGVKHRVSRRNLESILREQPHFWREMHAVAARLETDPAWLLNVMACESLFDPDARNPLPRQTASGLLQIIEGTAKRLGTTTAAIRRMSAVEQLRFVEKYLEPFTGRLNAISDVYTAVFRGSIFEGGDAVVVVDSTKEPRVYALNRSLDINSDRRITKGELGLAALSVGRFMPARAALGKKTGTHSSGGIVFARRKGKTPHPPVESLDPATFTSDDSTPRTTQQTRSIYVRRGGVR